MSALPSLGKRNICSYPQQLIKPTPSNSGPGSSVGIVTDYGLDGPGSNPGTHFIGDWVPDPASYKMGTGSFPGVKCGRGVLLTTHPLLVPWSWKSRAIPLPTL